MILQGFNNIRHELRGALVAGAVEPLDEAGIAVFEVQTTAASLSSPVKEQESTNIFVPGQGRPAAPAPRSTAPPSAPVENNPLQPRIETPPPVPASGAGTPTPATPVPKPDDFPPPSVPGNTTAPKPPSTGGGPPEVPRPSTGGPPDIPPPGAPTIGPDGKPRDAMPDLPPP